MARNAGDWSREYAAIESPSLELLSARFDFVLVFIDCSPLVDAAQSRSLPLQPNHKAARGTRRRPKGPVGKQLQGPLLEQDDRSLRVQDALARAAGDLSVNALLLDVP